MKASNTFFSKEVVIPEPADGISKTGKLGSYRLKEYYPEFGETTIKNEENDWKVVALQIAGAACAVLVGSTIGFVASGIMGAVIGATVGFGAVMAAVFYKVVVDQMEGGYRFLTDLPEEGQSQIQDNEKQCQLGRYYDANVRLTETADEAFYWKKKLIESAQETIELSANFAGGAHFREILQILDRKMKENGQLTVHMMLSIDLLEKEDREGIDRLKEEFGERVQFLITDRHYRASIIPITEENHVKMLIVDGKYFVSGGTGIHPRLSTENYDLIKETENPTFGATMLDLSSRDMDIVAESIPLSSVIRKQFFNLYRLWEIRTENEIVDNRYFVGKGNRGHCESFEEEGIIRDVRLKAIVGGPEHRGNNPISREYVRRIEKAEREVRFANLLFNPPKIIERALREVKEKNPEKKIIAYLNGIREGIALGNFLQTTVSRGYHDLLDKVYEYSVPNQVYHKKVATFDDTHMLIGSFNIGEKSSEYDHEVVFVVKDKEARVNELCKRILKEDRKRSVKVSREEIEQNHFWAKVASSIVKPVIENLFG